MTRPANPELVDALLRITSDLVIEKGARNVTMREIAGLAGVTPTTIHYYFDDKRGLFEATRLRAVAELDEAVAASVEASAGAVEQLRQAATTIIEWSLANPHGFALVFVPCRPGRRSRKRSQCKTTRPSCGCGRSCDGAWSGECSSAATQSHAPRWGFATLFGLSHLLVNRRLPANYRDDPSPVIEERSGRLSGLVRRGPGRAHRRPPGALRRRS